MPSQEQAAQKTLDLYPIDYPFETLFSRMHDNPPRLKLDPEFQRKYKWSEKRASKFIESCLMRIPLPSCYFAEDQSGNHFVIDGVQRLTTIKRFFLDGFKLQELTAFKELEGKKFSELGILRSELESTTIRCIILRKNNPDGLVREIFARLNQGAEPLSPQEIRHAVYGGSLDNLLRELAQLPEIEHFKVKGKYSRKEKKSLEAEEQVLRYFAFQQDFDNFPDRLSDFLDSYMERNRNLPESKIQEMRADFKETLRKCTSVFGDKVFINTAKSGTRQSIIYYDLLMYSFQKIPYSVLVENSQEIRKKFHEMCSNPDVRGSFSSGSQGKNAILKRREIWHNLLGEAIGQSV